MNANQLAQNVAAFISHNKIDTNKISIDDIVASYFANQLKAIDAAADELMGAA